MSAQSDSDKAAHSSAPAIDYRRPAITARAAAKSLGVSTTMVNGLVTAGQLAGYWDPGKSGRRIAMVYEDAVQQLRRRIEAMTPRPDGTPSSGASAGVS